MFLFFRLSDASASGRTEAETRSERSTKRWKQQRQVLSIQRRSEGSQKMYKCKAINSEVLIKVRSYTSEDLMCNISSPSVYPTLIKASTNCQNTMIQKETLLQSEIWRVYWNASSEDTLSINLITNGYNIDEDQVKRYSTHLFNIEKGNIKSG